jgi:universal stress protein A
MLAIRNILVPIDFSEATPRVLEYGRTLAEACGACLHLLHVLPCPVSSPESAASEREAALARLAALPAMAPDRERTMLACEIGTPAHEIIAYAEAHSIDLIVMGTHSHGLSFQMVAGSVAESVLGRAPCPVLAVQSAARAVAQRAARTITTV